MKGLRSELARAGIHGRLARRIELELEDHLRCNPEANIGTPREIAARFAEELRVPKTRRSVYIGFGALALTAALLGVHARGLSGPAGRADIFGARGFFESVGGLAIALGGQVAFVAGVLALWLVLQRPRDPQELRLAQHRIGVALAAGVVVIIGEATQAVALQPLLTAWWFAFSLAAVSVPVVALAGAARGVRAAAAVTPAVAPVPRPFSRPLVVAICAGVVALMTIGSAFAERSWAEGVTRGVIEGVAFAVCFLALGRRLGIRR